MEDIVPSTLLNDECILNTLPLTKSNVVEEVANISVLRAASITNAFSDEVGIGGGD
jgi:hypothetical protein